MSEIYEEYNEPIRESYDNYPTDSGEAMTPDIRDNIVSKLISTNERYNKLWMQLRGYAPNGKGGWKKGRELCGENFATKTLINFSSVVNELNSLSKKSESEVKRILHDAVQSLLLDMLNEPTIEGKDCRHLSKTFEHSLELFLGLVENGHGSKVMTSLVNGQKLDLGNQIQHSPSIRDYFGGRR